MSYSFKINSRGFLVERLQAALGIAADGVFGPVTRQAVIDLQARRRVMNLPVSGRGEAGAPEFEGAGIGWPSDFERCMNLVCGFEGTSFGDCNLQDIDGAGLTLGIAGFTTQHGEVQELMARYISQRPACLEILPSDLQIKLATCLGRRLPARAWKELFYGNDGRVLSAWVVAFARWGRCPIMQGLQLDMARERFWKSAVGVARGHGFSCVRADCFFLDVAVQNGGWRKRHLEVAQAMEDWSSGRPEQALVVAARAVAACAKERWRNDVLSRKMAIATGRGMVHGRMWRLRDFALL